MANPRASASWPLGLGALTARPAYLVPQGLAASVALDRSTPPPSVIRGHGMGDSCIKRKE